MKFAHKLAHLVFPRESNNQKAKLLHSSSLSFLVLFIVIYQLVLNFLPQIRPDILGFAANIAPSEVIRLTNEKRAQAGLPALTENGTLSQAAQAKGADMLNRDYWSHIAPDGTQPWTFFTNAGYRYRYAGENLARDFSSPSSAVEAWMASSSHKDNIMSAKYKEIGIAVVEGDLAGVDTTIIVQFFGTKYTDTLPAVPIAEAKSNTTTSTIKPTVIPTVKPVPTIIATPLALSSASPASFVAMNKGEEPPQAQKPKITISPFATTKSVSLIIISVLLLVMVIDWVESNRKQLARISSRSFAHIAFFVMIFAIALILKAGQII
jgi:hypothetical protein